MLELLDPTGNSPLISSIKGFSEILSEIKELSEEQHLDTIELLNELKSQTKVLGEIRALLYQSTEYTRQILEIQRAEQEYKTNQRQLKNKIYSLAEAFEEIENTSDNSSKVIKWYYIKEYIDFLIDNYIDISNFIEEFSEKKKFCDFVKMVKLFEFQIN